MLIIWSGDPCWNLITTLGPHSRVIILRVKRHLPRVISPFHDQKPPRLAIPWERDNHLEGNQGNSLSFLEATVDAGGLTMVSVQHSPPAPQVTPVGSTLSSHAINITCMRLRGTRSLLS